MAISLKSLVQHAYNKYQAMEDGRYDVTDVPVINLIANSVRHSKLNKFAPLLQASNEAELAEMILALQNDKDLRDKSKAVADLLAICAETYIKKSNFENAQERLNDLRKKSFGDSDVSYSSAHNLEADAKLAFNFTRAFKNILIVDALNFINTLEQEEVAKKSPTHVHKPKPSTQLINTAFISAEKSKRIDELKVVRDSLANAFVHTTSKLIETEDRLARANKLVVANYHNEMAAKKQLGHQIEIKRALLNAVGRLTADLDESRYETVEALDNLYTANERIEALQDEKHKLMSIHNEKLDALRLEKQLEKNRNIDKYKNIIIAQLRKIADLTNHTFDLQDNVDLFQGTWQALNQELDKALQEIENLSIDNDALERKIIDLTSDLWQARDSYEALRSEKRRSEQKDLEIIMNQGREINKLKNTEMQPITMLFKKHVSTDTTEDAPLHAPMKSRL